MIGRRLAVVAAAVVIAAAGLVPPGNPAEAAEPCTTSTTRKVGGGPLTETVPVLFVHGINSDADTWVPAEDKPASRNIPVEVAKLAPGSSTWTFDYGGANPEWVTHERIGPALAAALICLSDASGSKVVVVGHSMGGLATQFAVNQLDEQGQPVAQRVAEVITIGTPFRGSALLSVVNGSGKSGAVAVVTLARRAFAAATLLSHAVLAMCASVAKRTEHSCDILSVFYAPQGRALEYESDEIERLPPWPDDVPVLALAGQLYLKIPFAGKTPPPQPVGDLIVSLDSAIAHSTAGRPVVVKCTADLLTVASLNTPCDHVNVHRHPTVARTITQRVQRLVASVPLAYATAEAVRVEHSGGFFRLADLPDGFRAVELIWSESGRRLAWVAESRDQGRQRLFLADVDTRTVRSWDCGWCQPIAFQGEHLLTDGAEAGASSTTLLRYPDDGGPPVPVAVTGLPKFDAEECTGPCGVRLLGGTGSADGLIITYSGSGGGNFGGAEALYRVGADGEAEFLAPAVGSGPPHDLVVSPDRRRIAYTSLTHLGACAEYSTLVMVDLDSEDSEEAALSETAGRSWVVSAWFGPDGTPYAATIPAGNCEDDTESGEPAVRVWRGSEDGQDWTPLSDSVVARAYSDNGWTAVLVGGVPASSTGEHLPGTLSLQRGTTSIELAREVTVFAWGSRR